MAVDASQLPGSISGYEGQLQQQQQTGAPLALPTPTDAQMSNLEFNAQQLYANSIANTGQLPNPQFVAESLATGSTPDNVSAYGDPTAAPYLTAGATGFGNKPTSMLGPSTGMPNVYQFDPNQYKAAVPSLVNQNQQFASLGEVPVANVGYFNSIVNGNRSEVQRWQSWLGHTGYLPNHSTNGYMDQATQSALQAYFVNLFMPQALYSKDQNLKLQATNFLQAMNVDPTKLAPAMYNDPSFQTELLSGWIQTQGNQDPRKALNDYSDQFGVDAVPAGVQQAAQPNLLQGLENTAFTGITLVPDLLGAIISPITGGNKVADFLNQANPAHAQSQNIEQALKQDGVSSQDIGALSPLMNQVSGDTGWLPFDWIDKQWNRGILTVAYFAGDNAYAGKDPKNSNPFDPSSPLGQHIASYQNDLGSGLFGEDWAKQHQTQDQIFNFLADSADPIYWAGGWFGRAESAAVDVSKLGLKVGSITAKDLVAKVTSQLAGTAVGGKMEPIFKQGSRTLKSEAVGDVLSQGMKDTMSKALDPKSFTQNAFAQAIIKVASNEDGGDALRTMLRIFDPRNPDEEKIINTALQSLEDIKSGAKSGDAGKIIEQLNEHFPHVMNGPSALYNMKVAMRSIQPSVIDRLSSGFTSRLRTLGGLPFTESVLDTDHVYDGAQQLKVHLNVAGVDGKTVDGLLNKWYSGTSDDRYKMLQDDGDVGKAIDTALKARGKDLAGWRAAESKIRSGSVLRVSKDVKNDLGPAPKVKRSNYLTFEDESGVVDENRASTLRPALQKQYDEWDQMLQDTHDNWGGLVTKEVNRLQQKDPNLDYETAKNQFLSTRNGQLLQSSYDAAIAQIHGMQEALAPTGASRPAPFFTGQLGKSASLPGSAYSLMTYVHSGKFGLATYEKMAAKLKMDALTTAWKKLALWQIATQLRIAGGDDIIRLGVEAAGDGHVSAAMKGMFKAIGSGFAGVGKKAAAGAVTSKLGKKLLPEDVGAQKWAQEYETFLKQRALTNPDYMDFYKYAQDFKPEFFDSATRDDEHYPVMFANSHRWISASPEVQAYMKAYLQHAPAGGISEGIAAAKKFYEEDPRGQQALSVIDGATPESMANELSQHMERIYPTRTMKKWVTSGLDAKQFYKLWNNRRDLFAHTVSPRMNVNAHAGMLSRLGAFTRHDFMEPFINDARGSISQTLKGSVDKDGNWQDGLIAQQIRKAVGDNPNWSEDRIKLTASMEARAWARNNLYQGQRSMAGTALRHVFPFYGATANMTKFFMRQFDKHPAAAPTWQRLFAFSETRADQNNNSPTDSASGLLQALGFTPGDTIGSNWSHMFFFTNDGFASFVPGFGPVFGPVLHGISQDPTLSAMAASVPGLREQVSMQSGDQYTMFPWLEKVLSGVGLMSPLHTALTVPVIGGNAESYQTKFDQKYEQMTAANQAKGLPPPSEDEVKAEVGKEELTGAVIGGLAPFEKGTVSDVLRQQKDAAMKQFNAATTDTERDQIIAQADPQMKAYLTYEDPRTPQSEEDVVKQQMANMGPGTSYDEAVAALGDKIKVNKDDLIQQNPWILDYATSVYTTGATKPAVSPIEATGPEPGTAGFQSSLAAGDIAPMSLQGDNGLQAKLSAAWEIQNGWQSYEHYVVVPQQKVLSQLGGSTSSAEYKQFDSQYLQPILQVLKGQYPTWYNNFVSQQSTPSDLAGYAEKAAPLNTVTAWETIPHFAGDESQRTIMWRKATFIRDQAANALEELQIGKAPKIEQDQVYSQLQQQLGQLAQEYPQYASELQTAYANSWKDIVNYETVMEKTYGYQPNAEPASGQ